MKRKFKVETKRIKQDAVADCLDCAWLKRVEVRSTALERNNFNVQLHRHVEDTGHRVDLKRATWAHVRPRRGGV